MPAQLPLPPLELCLCLLHLQLIRSMKNALVKQTAEAVKRAAPAPATRPRLGGKARQAAAAATARAADAAQAGPGRWHRHNAALRHPSYA